MKFLSSPRVNAPGSVRSASERWGSQHASGIRIHADPNFAGEKWMSRGRLTTLLAVALLASTSIALFAQTLVYTRKPDAKNGKTIYEGGCIACHGADGKGADEKLTEFKRPDTWPDFSRCDQTTPEPDSAWKAVIVNGGPYLGFSTIMPRFRDLLSNDQID